MCLCIYVACFITKSFLTFIFPPTPALSTISRPLPSYMCSITPETAKVGSSYSHMRGPGIGCWFSDRSNVYIYCSCRSFAAAVLLINPNIYTDQWEPIIIYHSIILQTHYHFKFDFQKVDLHTGGTWLIHGNRNRKDNQLQNMEIPVEYPRRESKHETKDSGGNMIDPIFKRNVQGRKHPGRCTFAEWELINTENLNMLFKMKRMTINVPIIVLTIMMR